MEHSPRIFDGALFLGTGWRRLYRRSLVLGVSALRRGILTRDRQLLRAAVNRLLVPLDSWRYYELGRIADEHFAGRCLDVSSPKLLPSLLHAEGLGEWTAVDLFSQEIELWTALDPKLPMAVEDARNLRFSDETFDNCVCASVIEHIRPDGDIEAMAEFWRVLRPGGTLHLTTNMAAVASDVFMQDELWGEATERVGDRVFFERRFSEAEVRDRLLRLDWQVEAFELVTEKWPFHKRFSSAAPFSYLAGPLLRFVSPRNFRTASAQSIRGDFGVGYLRLRKPS